MKARAAALALVLLCACKSDGDGDGSGACGAVAACGGDVEGTWNVADLCISNAADLAGMSVDEPECSNLFVGAEVGATGSMTFASGTATSNVTMTLDLHAVWTKACIEAVAGASNIDVAATCANLDTEYSTNPQFSGGSCMVSGGNCDCVISSERPFALGSQYSVNGSQLSFTGDDPATFCVDGDQLQIAGRSDQTNLVISLTR